MTVLAVRRADFLMTLAYATDLATGHARDFALRSCVLAMRLAEVLKLDEDTRRAIYHQDWDEQGFKNFVSDPDVPAILEEAGHVGKPQAALLGGNFSS